MQILQKQLMCYVKYNLGMYLFNKVLPRTFGHMVSPNTQVQLTVVYQYLG